MTLLLWGKSAKLKVPHGFFLRWFKPSLYQLQFKCYTFPHFLSWSEFYNYRYFNNVTFIGFNNTAFRTCHATKTLQHRKSWFLINGCSLCWLHAINLPLRTILLLHPSFKLLIRNFLLLLFPELIKCSVFLWLLSVVFWQQNERRLLRE